MPQNGNYIRPQGQESACDSRGIPGGRQVLNQLLGNGLAAVLDELTRERPSVTIHTNPNPESTVSVASRNGYIVTIIKQDNLTVVGSARAWGA